MFFVCLFDQAVVALPKTLIASSLGARRHEETSSSKPTSVSRLTLTQSRQCNMKPSQTSLRWRSSQYWCCSAHFLPVWSLFKADVKDLIPVLHVTLRGWAFAWRETSVASLLLLSLTSKVPIHTFPADLKHSWRRARVRVSIQDVDGEVFL